jgi:hypothetical protein
MSPGPQGVPSVTFPVASQTDVPLAQLVVPVLHGIPAGMHAVPVGQEQLPPVQARLVPQAVPLGAGAPVFVHTGAPVAHDCEPTLQGAPGGTHEVPAMQDTQLPALHTMLVPHEVPFETLAVKVQTMLPVEQVVIPVRHSPGVQT